MLGMTAQITAYVGELDGVTAGKSFGEWHGAANGWLSRVRAATASMPDRDRAARLCRWAGVAYDVCEQRARERQIRADFAALELA